MDALAERAPDVDDVLATDLEASILAVRRTENEDVALGQHCVEANEAVVAHVGIGADDPRPGPRKELPELVAERRPRIVGLGLERHAEDADGLAGQALVHEHRGVPEDERVVGEGRQLHRVLEEARPGGEARSRQIGGSRVVETDGPEDVAVVKARLVGLDTVLAESDILILGAPHREYRGLEVGGKDVVDIWGALGQGIHL